MRRWICAGDRLQLLGMPRRYRTISGGSDDCPRFGWAPNGRSTISSTRAGGVGRPRTRHGGGSPKQSLGAEVLLLFGISGEHAPADGDQNCSDRLADDFAGMIVLVMDEVK